MPSEALKAAAKMNNDSSDADSDVDVKKVRDDSSTAPLKALNGSNNSAKSPKVDKSRSTVRFQHKLPSGRIYYCIYFQIIEFFDDFNRNCTNKTRRHY